MTQPGSGFAGGYRSLGVGLLAWSIAATALAQEGPGGAVSVIQSVDAAPVPEGDRVTVTVRSDGPLPAPRIGVLEGPPRVYMDFRGVRLPSRLGADWSSTTLRGVRMAQYSADPLVAGIVLDLHAPVPYRLRMNERGAGKVVLVVGGGAGAPQTSGADSATARYRGQVSEMLPRLEALRAVLQSIDRRSVAADADLLGVALELDTLNDAISRFKAPVSYVTAHDLLVRSCALGARAVRLRHGSGGGGETTAALNAASAAAGALILLDRAVQDLGPLPPP